MLPKILADENIDCRIIKKLRSQNFHVISISEDYKGIPDREVLKIAHRENALLLTEDSDFGEWVFVHKEKLGVIFLRYQPSELIAIIDALTKTLVKYGGYLADKFVVITLKKIRIREIL